MIIPLLLDHIQFHLSIFKSVLKNRMSCGVQFGMMKYTTYRVLCEESIARGILQITLCANTRRQSPKCNIINMHTYTHTVIHFQPIHMIPTPTIPCTNFLIVSFIFLAFIWFRSSFSSND